MSIRLRLILGFNIFLVALGVVGFLAVYEVSHSRDLASRIGHTLIARIEQAGHIGEELSALRSLESQYVMADDGGERSLAEARMTDRIQSLEKGIADYQATFGEGEAPEAFAPFLQDYRQYLATHSQLTALVSDGRTQEAAALYRDSGQQFAAVRQSASLLSAEGHSAVEQAAAEQSATTDRLRNILIGGLLAAAILILVVGHSLVTYISRRLRTLTASTERVTQGDLDQRITFGGRDEFGALAQAFNAMVESLQASNRQVAALHEQTLRMWEERIALLREGMTRVVKAQENERQRVARELHDQAGQGLTALQLGLSSLEKTAPSAEVKEAAASLRMLTVETMNIIRDLARDLRPSALDDLGLIPALRDYIKTFSSRVGIPIDFKAPPIDGSLPEETKITLFRIVQEGLTNIAKHAQATRAQVSLEAEDGNVRLVIEDNGVGFDVEHALTPHGQASLGLFGIQERCHLLGGQLHISSEPAKGTRLTITLAEAMGGQRDGRDSLPRAA